MTHLLLVFTFSQLKVMPYKPEISRELIARTHEQDMEELKLKKLLREKRVDEAESRLPHLEAIGVDKSVLSWLRADLSIRRANFPEAFKQIKFYLHGDKPGTRQVSGEPCMKIWEAHLASVFSTSAESERLYSEFFKKNSVVMPNSTSNLDVRALKTNNMVRSLLWLSAFEIRTGNLLRAKFYLGQAKTLDSNLDIPSGFDAELKRYRTIRTQEEQIDEAQGGFVMFDPKSVVVKPFQVDKPPTISHKATSTEN